MMEIPEGVPWPPPAIPVPGPVTVSGVAVFNGPCLFMGYSIAAGAAAGAADLFDGGDATGQFLGTVDQAANLSSWPWFGDHGIYCHRGLFVNTTAALSKLTLFLAPLWRPGDR